MTLKDRMDIIGVHLREFGNERHPSDGLTWVFRKDQFILSFVPKTMKGKVPVIGVELRVLMAWRDTWSCLHSTTIFPSRRAVDIELRNAGRKLCNASVKLVSQKPTTTENAE